MKKIYILSLFVIANSATAATPWWEQPTICKLNPTNCYVSMGTGFDSGMWDATSNCWGLKLICADATSSTTDTEPVPIGKSEIANNTGIKSDFDTNILNNNCYGARKTASNGSMASVNGTFVKIWCPGILENVDEVVPNGEITFGVQPKCSELANNGYVGLLNQKCYGKSFDTSKYYIECESNQDLPGRLIISNGADIIVGTESTPVGNYPANATEAKNQFDIMESVSRAKKDEHF